LSFRARRTVLRAGDSAELILWLSGAGAVRMASAGKTVVTHPLGPGSVWGDAAALCGGISTAWLTTTLSSELCLLRGGDFQRLLTLQPDLTRWFLEDMGRRLEAVSRVAATLALQRTSERLHAYLWGHARFFESRGSGCWEVPAQLGFTQRRMATDLGVGRKTLQVALARLEEEGLLARDGRHLTLLSPDGAVPHDRDARSVTQGEAKSSPPFV
jgi:CRP-like cAMP-binding protein